ncbi:hypothetical protein P152DRAFT_113039 [Eremomyces bilateralis CBS 781.70]|uniref:ML-like domain-containing protein n=1 Tax=Eremomyces bilateralis CBS 781.70 TaxID=1392243 RepID=A0A6G1GDI9_9PEZI|nr:uncharacterized protein P152DRAFT_113039 [Eremomyces bilateralis CBS 781.70]KAF1816175.1 hypothetical protein P152DRAFT_113039 [Eremomyces bilateralis CBS 781.70]
MEIYHDLLVKKRRRWSGNGRSRMERCDSTLRGLSFKRRMPLRWHFMLVIALSILSTAIPRTNAAFLAFENCLPPGMISSGDPKPLQFVPHFFSATFNATNDENSLDLTVYGNVTGQAYVGELPPPTDPAWKDPGSPAGKILNVSETNNYYSTIFSEAKVLTFTPWVSHPAPFCDYVRDEACPIAPAFFQNGSNPHELPSFSVSHKFFSTYAFSTFSTRIWVQSGDLGAPSLACVTANVTPSLGRTISDTLTYVPAAILVLMAISTVTAACFSPWSSPDPFHWTSNYGRDGDVLRLVTPGFGDCLQYIQFIVLAGSLTLNYPGFFQPVISKASWSALVFNRSFASNGPGAQSLVDDVYVVNATFGLSALGQVVGVSEDEDIWTSMAIWFAVILGAVILLCQLGFLIRSLHARWRGSQDVDRQSKNLPFTLGNMVRVVFNFFFLPIVSLTLFQLVVAPHSQAAVTAMAVVLLVLVVISAIWIFRLIFATRPRVQLFDHLPTLLLYGPLYNTYSDEAAPFAFIPVVLNSIRGIAIGAIQPSGIAQIVVLAICEVIFLLTLHAFRPFQSPTSMTAYHTFFSVFRLSAILLSVAFVPTLDVSEGVKGWIGYVILLLHAIVLAFGFFLNALQTLIEVFARLLGAGRDERGGLSKVFGMRQLSKRHRKQVRRSEQSDAAMLASEHEPKSAMDARSRSLSASSGVLLQQHLTVDRSSQGDITPGGAQSPFNFIAGSSAPSVAAVAGARRPTVSSGGKPSGEHVDPYYRPPRARRPTLEISPVAGSSKSPQTPTQRESGTSADGSIRQQDEFSLAMARDDSSTGDLHSSTSISFSPSGPGGNTLGRRNSIVSQGYMQEPSIAGDQRRTTDYAIREADFYYGVQRGPALSSTPTRRLKTGPADPTSPASSAAGWFRGLVGMGGTSGGQTWPWSKPKHKGFEVVRSKPAAIAMMNLDEEDEAQVRYRDDPDLEAGTPTQRRRTMTLDSTDEAPRGGDELDATAGAARSMHSYSDYDSPRVSRDDDAFNASMPPRPYQGANSSQPPILAPISSGSSLHMPSRAPSKTSAAAQPYGVRSSSPPPPMPVFSSSVIGAQSGPTVPRRSSRHPGSADSGRTHPTLSPYQDSSIYSQPMPPAHAQAPLQSFHADNLDPRAKTEDPDRDRYNVSAYSNFSGTKTPSEYYRRSVETAPSDDDPRAKTDVPNRNDISAFSFNKTPVEHYLRPGQTTRMPFSGNSEETSILSTSISPVSDRSGLEGMGGIPGSGKQGEVPAEGSGERPMSTGTVAHRVGEGMRTSQSNIQGEQAEVIRR